MSFQIKFMGKIKFEDERLSRALYLSLIPDNLEIPEGISIDMDYFGDTLSFNISSKANLDTTLSTLNDIITSIQNGVNVLSKVIRENDRYKTS
ncbi:hypothetical protein HRbin06_00539 [archaeon HR06]|nr:hypothetical protein HRbin06_00539 [archaeon HR06]